METFCSFDPLFKSEITLGNSPVRKEDAKNSISAKNCTKKTICENAALDESS